MHINIAKAGEAAQINPAFGKYENAVQISGGISLKGKVESLFYSSLIYEQPNTFFRINGRRSIELFSTYGLSKKYTQYSNIALGASQEIVLGIPEIYPFLGLGIYTKSKQDNRISSNFTFGEILGIGTKLSNFNIEMFARHFSNGRLQQPNTGQNFVGLRVGYLF